MVAVDTTCSGSGGMVVGGSVVGGSVGWVVGKVEIRGSVGWVSRVGTRDSRSRNTPLSEGVSAKVVS